MSSLLNKNRPPAFCPGCSHERVAAALDKALQQKGLGGEQVVIVSDIGCCGLFDTFFDTHAFHGLHGRALTYATGIKMARPESTVVVIMGDGGVGIGGAHVVSTCRRNIDLTLLVLDNFNYGMTGGQCSATTPMDARTASGFLNRLEHPLDIAGLAAAAGATYAARISAYRQDLAEQIRAAIDHNGFSIVDIWGLCTGRYTKRNQVTPARIEAGLSELPSAPGPLPRNARPEYSRHYRELAAAQKPAAAPATIEAGSRPPFSGRREVLLLGSAGQRIVTAGEILCLSALTAGLHATQKNDYPITVLRGHSVSEVVLSDRPVGYTGLESCAVVLALAGEGVSRRAALIRDLDKQACIISAEGVDLPPSAAHLIKLDFKGMRIKPADYALAALAVLAGLKTVITVEMLRGALACRFAGNVLEAANALIARFSS